jgi:hypothetical protein
MIAAGNWLAHYPIWVVALSSFSLLILSIACLPTLIARLRSDCFFNQRKTVRWDHPRHLLFFGLKNLIGLTLFLVGLLLLFLPGQGLLTILIGLMVMNYPGKSRREHKIVRMPGVLASLNWARGRYNVTPLTLERPTGQTNSFK